jgi:hypothetical protein
LNDQLIVQLNEAPAVASSNFPAIEGAEARWGQRASELMEKMLTQWVDPLPLSANLRQRILNGMWLDPNGTKIRHI